MPEAPFPVIHETVIGRTGSGKSYYAWQKARQAGYTLWWNTDDDDPPPGIRPIQAAPHNYASQLVEAARGPGRVVSFVPDDNLLVARAQLGAVCAHLMRPKRFVGIRFVVDEAHEYARNNQQSGPLQEIARRGRKRAIAAVFITQRPAALSKDLTSMSRIKTIFRTDDWDWLADHELPADAIMRAFSQTTDEHAYVQVIDGTVRGPFVI